MTESSQIEGMTRALEHAEQTFGVVSKEYSAAMAELALGWKSQGELDRAIQLQSQVADLDRRIYGKDSYEFVKGRYRLAASLAEAGDASAAAIIQRALVSEVIARVGYNREMSTQAMEALADSLFADHQYEELKDLLQHLIPASRVVHGAFSTNELAARSLLGRCLSLMGRFNEAYEVDSEIVRNLTNEHDIEMRISFQSRLLQDCAHLDKTEEMLRLLIRILEESRGLPRKQRKLVRDALSVDPSFISMREAKSGPVFGLAVQEMLAKFKEL
jgi:hypothetical protein